MKEFSGQGLDWAFLEIENRPRKEAPTSDRYVFLLCECLSKRQCVPGR